MAVKKAKLVEKKSTGTPRNTARDAVPPRSEGMRLLLAVKDSLAVISRAAGAGRTSVHRWLSGEGLPDEQARKKLCSAYAIPVDAWERSPSSNAAESEPASDPVARSIVDVPSSSAMHFFDLMTEVKRTRIEGNLSSSEVLKAIEREGALRAQYERAKGADRATEELIVRDHPHWARFEEELMKVLSRHPDVMREVAEVMEKVR